MSMPGWYNGFFSPPVTANSFVTKPFTGHIRGMASSMSCCSPAPTRDADDQPDGRQDPLRIGPAVRYAEVPRRTVVVRDDNDRKFFRHDGRYRGSGTFMSDASRSKSSKL